MAHEGNIRTMIRKYAKTNGSPANKLPQWIDVVLESDDDKLFEEFQLDLLMVVMWESDNEDFYRWVQDLDEEGYWPKKIAALKANE
jgi:hypothetical protein